MLAFDLFEQDSGAGLGPIGALWRHAGYLRGLAAAEPLRVLPAVEQVRQEFDGGIRGLRLGEAAFEGVSVAREH